MPPLGGLLIKRTAWPIRVRLTLLASGVMALVCLLVSVLVMVGVRNQAADYKREHTVGAALRTVHLIKRGRLPGVLPADGADAIQVLDAGGQPIAATRGLAGAPPIATFRPTEDSVTSARELCPPRGLHGCMVVVAFRVYQPDGDWTVYAADQVVEWYVSTTLLAFLAGISALLIGLTAAGASRTVSRTLVQVDAIRSELAEITATDTGRRVPVPRNHDEIRSLAETANATLDRLDAALNRLRRFTSDASHDLRSPITAARAQVEEALLHPDDTDWPQMATAVLASLDRLQAIVTDLLDLSKLDAGEQGACEPVDLAQLVTTELTRHGRRVPVNTDLADGVVAIGDPLRLTRLLVNLVDNAERHAVGHITITVRPDGDDAVLEVLDDGAGIALEHRETVFERFTRLDAARNRDAGGTGLGLPIARQIAEAHGGTLEVADSPRGARLVLRLPRLHQPVRSDVTQGGSGAGRASW